MKFAISKGFDDSIFDVEKLKDYFDGSLNW